MRSRVLTLGLLLSVGCSTAMGLDAGVDAGVDAGPGCLDPDAGFVDAGPGDGGDLSCLGRPLPATAAPLVTVSGFITSAGITRYPISGALVELFDPSGTLLDSVLTSTDGGTYRVSGMSGCIPLAGSMRASKPDAGYYDVWYYPPTPWQRGRGALELTVFDQGARNLVSAIAGVAIQDGGAAIALGIDDCSGSPVSGATVTTSPQGTVRYVAESGLPSPTLMATTGKGQLLIFNLPAGDVTITTTVGGQTFRTKTFNARADAITATTVTP